MRHTKITVSIGLTAASACLLALSFIRPAGGETQFQSDGLSVVPAYEFSVSMRAEALEILGSPIFDEMSSAGQMNIQRMAGARKIAGVIVPFDFSSYKPIPYQDASSPETSNFVDPLVNDPTLDGATARTQSETSIVLGSGNNVVSSYNDSGSNAVVSNKFTGYSTSANSGTSWTDRHELPTAAGNGDAGDPTLARNATTGTILLGTLNFNLNDNLNIYRSTDNGVTFSAPINGTPGFSGGSGNHDKEWLTADNFPGTGNGNFYLFWRNFGTPGGMTLTRSTDDGITWGPSGGVSLITGSGQGAQVAVGPDHSVYCEWFTTAPSIVIRRSTDLGLTFGATSIVTPILSTGTNGDLGLNGTGGSFRSSTFPQLVVNPVGGNLYTVYPDNPAGADKADIFFRQSTDNGLTWSAAVRVNTDAGTNDNFQPSLAVMPDGSALFVGFYDRRRSATNDRIEYWGRTAAISGSTVTFGCDFPISSSDFPVVVGVEPLLVATYMGDYDAATANNSNFYVQWGDNRSGNPDVRFALIPKTGDCAPIVTPTPCPACTPTPTPTPTPIPTPTPTPTPTPPCNVSVFSNPALITINDAGPANPYPSNITVSGVTNPVVKVTVTLNGFTHTFPSDVDVLLVGPGGQKFILVSDVIGGTDAVGINWTFDDTAAAFIGSTGTPASGTFKPTNYTDCQDPFAAPAPAGPYLTPGGIGASCGTDTLAAFNGINPNGTWSLYVVDDLGTDVGTITGGWSLSIGTNAACGTPSPSPSATATPTAPATPTPSATPTPPTTPTPPPATPTPSASASASPCGTAVTFSNPAPITLTDCPSGCAVPQPASLYPSNIAVSGVTGPVTKVTVTITGYNHTFPADSDMLLVGPGGQKFILASDVIGGTDAVGINWTFDDTAAAFIGSTGTPASGTFKPSNYTTCQDTWPAPAPAGTYLSPGGIGTPCGTDTLAAFNGIDPNGTWSLYIADDANIDSGTITGGWSLSITTAGAGCPSPTPSATVTPGTPSPTPSCPPSITESSTQTITALNSVSCNTGGINADNSYWRAFNMNSFIGSNSYNVTSVSFGVEQATAGAGGTQPVTVRLYTSNQNFPTGFPASLTQLATTTVNVPDSATGTVFTVPIVATVPAGAQLVMEVNTPDGATAGNSFFIGTNADPESAPSYLSAADCGITTPTTTTAIGFPNMHIVFNVFGSCTGVTPTPGTPSPTATAGTPSPTPTCAPNWSGGPAFPAVGAVRAAGSFFPSNGRFYAIGGRSSDTAGSDFTNPFEYNPTTNAWTTKPSVLPDNQVNNMACGVLTVSGTDQIYCVGGSAAGATTATARVFSYNPATDTFTVLAAGDNWPGDASGTVLPGGFAVAGNKLYIFGGFTIGADATAQTWQFDPTLGVGAKWLQRQDLPLARGYVPAASIGGIIYTGGGASIVTAVLTDTADSFKYDPVGNTWTAITNIPRATGETRAVAMNGKMWVLGGGRTAPNPSTEVDIYDPVSNAWSVGLPFTTARRNFPADSDGTRIFLAGGYDSSGTVLLNTMEIFGAGGACASPTPPPATPTPTLTPPPGTPTPTPTPTPATPTPTPTPPVSPTPTPPASPTPTPPTGTPTPTPPTTPTPTPGVSPPSQAVNLSTRMHVEGGDRVGIGGFIVTGAAPKRLIVRAIGPSLTRNGLTDVLADPVLELHGPTGFVTITNDNWRDTQEAEIQATGLPPTNSLESAIVATLPPGTYTAIVRGNGATAAARSGLALVEIYDLEEGIGKLGNISTRAFVGTNDNVVIAGFILGNNGGEDNVIVRGMGPSLASQGVPTVLADPTLQLRDANGALLSSNNDWQDNAAQAAIISAAGLAPGNALESAIAATLPPGLYTALLAGLNNGTGIGLVEVYDRADTP